MNFQMFKLDIEKAEETEIKLPTSIGPSKSERVPEKNLLLSLLTMPKPLTVWDHNKLENSKRDGNIRPPYLLLEKSVCRSRSNS